MSTSSPRLKRKPWGDWPGCTAGSIATTEMLSAVTPGALAFSPVCFAVSLVQNAVVDVNGEVVGSGVTVGATAPAPLAPTPAVRPRVSAATSAPIVPRTKNGRRA